MSKSLDILESPSVTAGKELSESCIKKLSWYESNSKWLSSIPFCSLLEVLLWHGWGLLVAGRLQKLLGRWDRNRVALAPKYSDPVCWSGEGKGRASSTLTGCHVEENTMLCPNVKVWVVLMTSVHPGEAVCSQRSWDQWSLEFTWESESTLLAKIVRTNNDFLLHFQGLAAYKHTQKLTLEEIQQSSKCWIYVSAGMYGCFIYKETKRKREVVVV